MPLPSIVTRAIGSQRTRRSFTHSSTGGRRHASLARDDDPPLPLPARLPSLPFLLLLSPCYSPPHRFGLLDAHSGAPLRRFPLSPLDFRSLASRFSFLPRSLQLPLTLASHSSGTLDGKDANCLSPGVCLALSFVDRLAPLPWTSSPSGPSTPFDSKRPAHDSAASLTLCSVRCDNNF